MSFPLISEYIESIKLAEENFNELSYLRPVFDDDGMPVMTSGNFAVVFKMEDARDGKLYAVKCFTREQEGREEAYKVIAEELKSVESPYIVPIRYLEKELFVDSMQADETEFPVLLMDWVDGKTLDKYLRENLDDKYALEMLAYRFSQLAQWLIPQPFAHGDLKPDNILVREDGTLVLVDYDGMYVPVMKGQKARELGSPDFRHPLRTEDDFDEHIDDFPLVSILLSLKAISLNPQLLEKYGAADRLLFSEKDYRDISQCDLLKELYPSDDCELNILLSLFTINVIKFNHQNVFLKLYSISRPSVPEMEIPDTQIHFGDTFNAITYDRVLYDYFEKRLLIGHQLPIIEYAVRKGTMVICDRAFAQCSALKAIKIPNSVIAIGVFAFFDCRSLSEITIPNSVLFIGKDVFAGCNHLISIIVEKDNPCYDSRNNCNAIIESKSNTLIAGCSTTIIPNSVTCIGDMAFSKIDITTILIPNNVISIGDMAFSDCTSLTEIMIPSSVIEIGEALFVGCNHLVSIIVEKDNPCYDSRNNCNAIIESKSNTLIAGCSTTIIPNSITCIGERAFEECENMTSIVIPSCVTTIKDKAFSGCTGLTEILIPSSVIEIGYDIFDGCTNLIKIECPNKIKKRLEESLPEYKNKLWMNAIYGAGDAYREIHK